MYFASYKYDNKKILFCLHNYCGYLTFVQLIYTCTYIYMYNNPVITNVGLRLFTHVLTVQSR